MMRWYDIGPNECLDLQTTWDTVQQRAHDVNSNIPENVEDKYAFWLHTIDMKLRFIGLARKFFAPGMSPRRLSRR
jgi:hypothetical protein